MNLHEWIQEHDQDQRGGEHSDHAVKLEWMEI